MAGDRGELGWQPQNVTCKREERERQIFCKGLFMDAELAMKIEQIFALVCMTLFLITLWLGMKLIKQKALYIHRLAILLEMRKSYARN